MKSRYVHALAFVLIIKEICHSTLNKQSTVADLVKSY